MYQHKLSAAAKRDDACSAWQTATATRDAAQAALDELLHGSTPEQLAQARAAADAALAAARLTLQQTRLTAPMGRGDRPGYRKTR